MGMVVSVIVGLVLTSPLSGTALWIMLNLSGISAGAAAVGCCTQMVGFAATGYIIYYHHSAYSHQHLKDDEYARRGRDGNLRVCGTDFCIYRYGNQRKINPVGSIIAFYITRRSVFAF